MGFLTDTVAEVRRRLERDPPDTSALMALAAGMPPTRPFVGSLWAAEPPALIAEIKRASPSAGAIAGTDPATVARAYERAGAAAVSVLTEPRHFGGALADLRAVRLATRIPLLRKDFLIHPDQVIETRASGGDAVLLIVAAQSDAELRALLATAEDLGVGALVEVHTSAELERAVATDAKVIGVNARDLETLEVDVDRALELVSTVPGDRIAVLESAIATRAHVDRAIEAGARAILVGEALMRARDPVEKARELLGDRAHPRSERGHRGSSPARGSR